MIGLAVMAINLGRLFLGAHTTSPMADVETVQNMEDHGFKVV